MAKDFGWVMQAQVRGGGRGARALPARSACAACTECVQRLYVWGGGRCRPRCAEEGGVRGRGPRPHIGPLFVGGGDAGPGWAMQAQVRGVHVGPMLSAFPSWVRAACTECVQRLYVCAPAAPVCMLSARTSAGRCRRRCAEEGVVRGRGPRCRPRCGVE
jgi:hypothetical protein